MKQQLWQLNSSLLAILLLILLLSVFIKKEAPIVKIAPLPITVFDIEEKPISKINFEKIYKNDLFDTYEERPEFPVSLITPIPEPKIPMAITMPPTKKPELLEPLKVTLKGILFSTGESNKSIALIEDETKKEQSYCLGEQIKDSQVIRIAKDRIVILRNNGQQEALFLRKEDNLLNLPKENRWAEIIKKIDENTFHINPSKFTEEIPTLGQLLETLDPATIYSKGKPIGVQLGQLNKNEITQNIGLQTKDIIFAINGINVTTPEKRYEVFEKIINSKIEDEIKIELKREGQNISLTYRLTTIEKPPSKFLGEAPPHKPELFKLNREQQREQQQRIFRQDHPKNREEIREKMRERLLENLKLREKDMRFR